jgi:hypothetical protein
MKSNNATQKTPRGAVILRVLLQVLVLSLLCVRSARADGWSAGDVTTYTQTGWGDTTTPGGALLLANYNTLYSSTDEVFEVGIPGAAGNSMIFTSVTTLLAYLPVSGSPGSLDSDYADPVTTSAGVYGGDVSALKLNIDFSAAGLLPTTSTVNFGNLILTGFTGADSSLNNTTVNQFLALNQTALGGGSTTLSIEELESVLSDLDRAFDDGQPSQFAQDNLITPGTSAPMPEPSTLPLLTIGIFIVAFVAKKRALA